MILFVVLEKMMKGEYLMGQVMSHKQINNQLVNSHWIQCLSERVILTFKDVLLDK